MTTTLSEIKVKSIKRVGTADKAVTSPEDSVAGE